MPTPTWKERTDFPCHKMTALEKQSIVASCKYSNWQCFNRDKTLKGRIFLDHLDYLSSTKFSVPRVENRQNAHMETDPATGSIKPGALAP